METLRYVGLHHKRERLNPLHAHDHPEAVIYLAGSGVVEVAGRALPFTRGTVVSVGAGVPHLERSNAPYRSISFGYHHPRGRTPLNFCQDGHDESLRRLAFMLLREYHRKGRHWARLCNEGLAFFLTWIEARGESPRESAWVDRIEDLLLLHLTDPGFRLLHALRTLGPSPSHLIRLFTKARGRSPLQHLLHLRVQEAVHLLTVTDMTVAAVARRVGFEDPYYFSRAFRKITGHPPSHSRKGAPERSHGGRNLKV